jgi:hypothetical protein
MLCNEQAKKQKNTAQTRHICTIFFLRDERVLNMQEVKIVGRGVDTLVINVCYANEHFQPVKQELAKGVQHELEFYFAQRRMKYINRLASHVPLQYNCLNNTSIMLFTNQDREWFVTPPRSEGSRSMGTEMLRCADPSLRSG